MRAVFFFSPTIIGFMGRAVPIGVAQIDSVPIGANNALGYEIADGFPFRSGAHAV
jgi:hypothetical protein